jgi:UPF0755 protein
MRKPLSFIGIVFLLAAVVAFGWYTTALRPVDLLSTERTLITIPKGSSVRGIANLLKEKDMVRSAMAFSIYVKLVGAESELQAGTFFVRPSQSTSEIVAILRKGLATSQNITIPEGFTVRQIDELLSKSGLTTSGSIVACAQTCDFSAFTFLAKRKNLAPHGGNLEGYLFPETYNIAGTSVEPKAFLERMLRTFEERVVTQLSADIKKSGRSLHDIVIMASLLEEETKTAEERPIVSGILWRRLTTGIKLGVDATIRYVLEKGRGGITVADLNVNSPYNTRKFGGLPPGPISNPGLTNIKAALAPTESPYLYYLHDKSGRIHYAKTNEEHNVNKRLYLR